LEKQYFKTAIAENIFNQKYRQGPGDSWGQLAERLVDSVCGPEPGLNNPLMSKDDRDELTQCIERMQFIPGGRYLYYAGRPLRAYSNCYLLRAVEDTREEWARLVHRAMGYLSIGGGIGIDYSILRQRGSALKRTGGRASGPIPLMYAVNEIGRNVMQGGSRRSAIYGSLNWRHGDAKELLAAKNWGDQQVTSSLTLADIKKDNFNFPAPLDMTNVSLNYDNSFLEQLKKGILPEIFVENCKQALMTSEPGFSFNFGKQENETLRNACTEVTSEDSDDSCNLGSINLGNIDSLEELYKVVNLGTKFLICGSIRAILPYEEAYKVREKNRRIGLGLMGIHEWLLKRGERYEVSSTLKEWLSVYRSESDRAARDHSDRLYVSRPIAKRAIAPTGTIGILASTTTGIEPLFAVAYKRRYLADGTRWKYEYVVDATANRLIQEYGLQPEDIETAQTLSHDYERRSKFQAEVQDYVDMAISSTINLPAWGSDLNNPDLVIPFASILANYAPRLRGFTCYSDGSRGGQPLTQVEYSEAIKHKGVVFDEVDICSITGHGGSCGV
jgi:ribonucleoside-diphosphate reductase alpha chain